MTYVQDGRSLFVETPLGVDKLLLTAVKGREGVSDLFSFQLDILSKDLAILPEAVVGKPVRIGMRMADGRLRHVHGRVARFWMDWTTPEGLRMYQAEVVPWFWFLRRATDSRVYQNMSVPEIAVRIFEEFEFSDFDISLLREEHLKLEYSVQYQESYYDYLCRLFESEGIYFYFRHEEDRHVLVLADTNAGFKPAEETDLAYNPTLETLGYVTGWRHRFAFQPARLATSDYNQNAPATHLHLQLPTLMEKLSIENVSKYERFEWPGDYATNDVGDVVLRRRLQELDVGFHLVEGSSTCPGFSAGTRVKLADHPDPHEETNAFFLLTVEHEAEDTSVVTRDGGGAYRYRNSFLAFPSFSRVYQTDKHYRPLRRTPKPRIHGVQTAVVVGPPGETIHCDQQGRVKVQFHWDRHGPKDDGSSCWVRVSQSWAGAKFGSMQIPHVGQEVLVAFQEGDPDRPVIVGRVYNADQKNPLVAGAIAHKTQTMTRDQGGNHIITEGKDGHQRIELHSPKAAARMEMGAITQAHPAQGLLAKFSAAFPSASLAGGAGAGGSGPGPSPQQQARGAEESRGVDMGVGLSKAVPSARPGANDGRKDSTQAQADQSTNPSQDTDQSSWDGLYTQITGDSCRRTNGENWEISDEQYTVVNQDNYEIVQGSSYEAVKGDSYEYVDGGYYEQILGWSFTQVYGNECSMNWGLTEETYVGGTLEFYFGAVAEIYLSLKLEIDISKTLEIGGEKDEVHGEKTEVSGEKNAVHGSKNEAHGEKTEVSGSHEKAVASHNEVVIEDESAAVIKNESSASKIEEAETKIATNPLLLVNGMLCITDGTEINM